MDIEIIQPNKNDIIKYDVKNFLFKMVKYCYDLDYVAEYHYDIVDLEKYYIDPENSNIYLAIDTNKQQVIASCAIRNYDRDYKVKNRTYSKDDTASIHRMFVHPDYRHQKIGSKLIKCLEEFCIEKQYNQLYLHTYESSYGALSFWLYNNFKITYHTHDEDGTIHMEKILNHNTYNEDGNINLKETVST